MRKSQKGLAHLSLVFVLAILLIITTWFARQETSSIGQASGLPQDYYGILRSNNFYDCNSGYHLVNLEEDEVAHCLVVSTPEWINAQGLDEFINQHVKVYGALQNVADRKHLLIQSIEKTSTGFLPVLKNRVLNVLGAFIKRFAW